MMERNRHCQWAIHSVSIRHSLEDDEPLPGECVSLDGKGSTDNWFGEDTSESDYCY